MKRRHAVWALVACGTTLSHAADEGPRDLVGRWVGDARLFDRSLRAQATPLPTEVVIEPDLALSGRIGDAQWLRTPPVSATSTRIEYRVRLQGRVHALPALHKPCLVVIVARRAGPGLDADFHLKSRFGFDPSMRVGHLDVARGA